MTTLLAIFPMTTLLAIDPGACTGWARFEHGALFTAFACDPDAVWIPGHAHVVIERPDAHRGRNQRARPEDIATLLLLVGRYAERAECRGAKVELVHPSAWKGSVPKDVMGERVLQALSPEELSVLPDLPKTKRHNMIDAIGLGLWRLGRI